MDSKTHEQFKEELSALKGTEFQKLLIYFILTNEKFIPLCGVIPPEVFTEKYLERFYRRIQFIYSSQKKKSPLGIELAGTLEELYGPEQDPMDTITKQKIIQLLNKFSFSSSELNQFEGLIKEKTLLWLKEYQLVSLIRESALTYTETKDCNKTIRIIQKGVEKIKEYEFFFEDKILPIEDDNELFYERKNVIKTGLPLLDEYLRGGLGEGDFGLFATKSGGGKTWFLSWIALSGIRQQKTVLYITLELSKGQIFQRIGSLAIKKHIVNKQEFQETINYLSSKESGLGRLFIVERPPLSLNIEGISNIIGSIYREHNLKVDSLLIDYADYISVPGHESDDWKTLVKIYVQLKQLAKREKLSIWTVSQTTKESRNKDIVDADGFSGSYMKNAIVDVSLSFSPEKNSLFLIKNRFNEDGVLLSMMINKKIPEIIVI